MSVHLTIDFSDHIPKSCSDEDLNESSDEVLKDDDLTDDISPWNEPPKEETEEEKILLGLLPGLF